MQLDFWQFSEGPIERIVALIAERARAAGDMLLVVDADAARRKATSEALWKAKPEAFLANGDADAPHAARQPILLSAECEPLNGARFAIFADGVWRDGGESFDRTILLFGEAGASDARSVWRQFDGREDVTRGYFAQEQGKWVKKA
ncbi:MAG: DNA polymerase III subunit chi [Croceibacterium sp.]